MKETPVEKISLVGPGLIGHGIAMEFALAGYSVSIASRSAESAQRGMERIKESLEFMQAVKATSASQVQAAMSKLNPASSIE